MFHHQYPHVKARCLRSEEMDFSDVDGSLPFLLAKSHILFFFTP